MIGTPVGGSRNKSVRSPGTMAGTATRHHETIGWRHPFMMGAGPFRQRMRDVLEGRLASRYGSSRNRLSAEKLAIRIRVQVRRSRQFAPATAPPGPTFFFLPKQIFFKCILDKTLGHY